MKKLMTAAIFVIAMMMSATFAFGQGTGSSNPTGSTTVKMIITHPSIDIWTFEITQRWLSYGVWTDWETIERDAASYGQTELYITTYYGSVTKYEYQIAAKKQDGTPIAGTAGIFTINGTILYPHGWLR